MYQKRKSKSGLYGSVTTSSACNAGFPMPIAEAQRRSLVDVDGGA